MTFGMEAKRTGNDDPLPDIFARLEARGVDYAKVKALMHLYLPQTFCFSRVFPSSTIEDVFRRLERSEALLKADCVLSHFSDLKSQFEQRLRGLSQIAIHALIETNAIGGAWDLRVEFQPTGRDEEGQAMYIHPPFRIVATHRKQKKVAIQLREGEGVATLKQAFKEKGIWKELWTKDPSHRLVSRRAEQGWPFYTRLVIPQLYELLLPHYPSAGHRWAKHADAQSNRHARFPQQLLGDMLEILRLEHSHVFKETTVPHLRSAVQRHLGRKNAK